MREAPATLEEWEVPLGGGLATLSRRDPEVGYSVRPLGFRWLIRCSGPEVSLQKLRESTATGVLEILSHDPDNSALVFAYAPQPVETAFVRRLAIEGAIVLPPMTLREGLLRVRILATRRGRLPSGVGPGAHMVNRRVLTMERLREELDRQLPRLPSLTPRQSEVLLEAIREGYYEVPRRSNVLQIAHRLSLGRSTVEEHLRAAESAVIRQAVPQVELAQWNAGSISPEGPLEHFARYSSELELYVDLALRNGRVANVRFLPSRPRAGLRGENPYLTRILQHLRTGTDDLRDIPVDLRTSPFERRVLEELRRIPPGETRTYAEIARRLGRPGASRAVGNACAHNPAIVVIPCHRVVPSRGGIGNYSGEGGQETKRRLLQLEGAALGNPEPSRFDARESRTRAGVVPSPGKALASEQKRAAGEPSRDPPRRGEEPSGSP